jgi:hypothetical protein
MELTPQGMRYAMKFYKLFRSNLAKKLKIRVGKSFFNGPEASGSWSMQDRSPFEETRVMDPAPDGKWVQVALNKRRRGQALSIRHRTWSRLYRQSPICKGPSLRLALVVMALDWVQGQGQGYLCLK